jgi:glycosyltransferase involved in cell wall biosynthesis
MAEASRLKAVLVDPSLFTAPYDAALTEGLRAAGVEPVWMTRPTRRGDRQELPVENTDPFFYRRVDEAGWLPSKLKPVAKGIAHLGGLITLLRKIRARRPDVVHFQWIVAPPLDALALMLIRRWCPVVLTVHDTVPFNGERLSYWQNAGFDLPMKLAHRVIVHTESGRETLIRRGIPAHKIATIPHGSLRLGAALPPRTERADGRFSFLLFGEIKPYKGVDVLLDALAMLPPEVRPQTRVVIAGRPRMDMQPLESRIAALGLGEMLELRPQRQSEEEMAALFVEADCLLFPYLQIDASGVWFLTKSLGKWTIASRVGIFAAEVREDQGVLLPPGDAAALAHAIEHAVRHRPSSHAAASGDEWAAIGAATRHVYESLIPARQGQGRVAVQP